MGWWARDAGDRAGEVSEEERRRAEWEVGRMKGSESWRWAGRWSDGADGGGWSGRETWGRVGRWKNQDGTMPDGSSEMVRVVNCLEGEPEEAQSGDDRQQFRKQVSGRNVGSKGCDTES